MKAAPGTLSLTGRGQGEGDVPPTPKGHLADNIAGFARALRAAGLPVGPGAVLYAVGAVGVAGLARRDDLYWTLHAVFVNRRDQSLVFDAAFRLFWRKRVLAEALRASMPPSPCAAPGTEPPAPAQVRVDEALRPRARSGRQPDARREVTARLAASDGDVLRRRDFAGMSAAEVAAAGRAIERLVLPDDRRPTRRLRADPRGRQVDLRATLRRSLRTGGGSIDLAWRAPARKATPVVALVDISGSMAEYSRPILHFLHALARSGRRVGAFVFATRLTNISRELAGRDPDEALSRAAARVGDWEGGTRIGAALREFNRLWSRRVLGGRATVLLFTDGLEREVGDELPFETDRLRRSCGRLIWLNPLLRFDAFQARAGGVRAMLPHVDEFRPVHDLASVEALAAALAGPARLGEADPRRWLRAS